VKDRVFELMMYFLRHEEEEVKNNALTGLGTSHDACCDFLLQPL
jgi:hypothetical protein